MGLSETYINILNHPAVDATINFIKKFKSSKSYWSVSYLILLFTIREAIAWKFGSAIKTFCETQAVNSSFPTFWEVLGFVLDVGGSWELVALGTFVFVVLSLIKVAESEGTSISVRENYLTLFLLVFVGSLSFYQNDEVNSIVEENSKVLKKIEQDKNVTNYLIEDIKKKDLKYAKLEAEYESLRKSIREKAPNEKEIIDNANKILKEKGIESAIYYLKFELSSLKHIHVKKNIKTSTKTDVVTKNTQQETLDIVKNIKGEDNETILISNETDTKWIKPSDTTCISNGGEVNSNGCQATWEDAKNICIANGGSLPSIGELRKVIESCGGKEEFDMNRNNIIYQSCYKEQGFSRFIYWSKNTNKLSHFALTVMFEVGGSDLLYKKINKSYIMCSNKQFNFIENNYVFPWKETSIVVNNRKIKKIKQEIEKKKQRIKEINEEQEKIKQEIEKKKQKIEKKKQRIKEINEEQEKINQKIEKIKLEMIYNNDMVGK